MKHRPLTLAAILAAALTLSGCITAPSTPSEPVESETQAAPVETTEAEPVVETEAVEEAEPEPEPELTIGQQNAVDKAEQYLRYTAFSREGLINQLEFEDFSTEDATFAVDYIDVDWFEQAALKAEQYLEYSSFSRQGLLDQLLFEGFTQEEAEHGVAAVGY